MSLSLFPDVEHDQSARDNSSPGAVVLRSYALAYDTAILNALRGITGAAPLRHMITPGNFRMSAAMTNCGAWGWVTDRTGYRYDALDPETGKPWHPMPDVFLEPVMDIIAHDVEPKGSGC